MCDTKLLKKLPYRHNEIQPALMVAMMPIRYLGQYHRVCHVSVVVVVVVRPSRIPQTLSD